MRPSWLVQVSTSWGWYHLIYSQWSKVCCLMLPGQWFYNILTSATQSTFMQYLGNSLSPHPCALLPISLWKRGFFYSWVTKHEPIIPTLDSKLKKPLSPALPPVLFLPPALWGLHKGSGKGGFWLSLYVCTSNAMVVGGKYEEGGGWLKTTMLCFDYSNYDSGRGVDYYEHMGSWVVDELTSFQSVSITVKRAWHTKSFTRNEKGVERITKKHASQLILSCLTHMCVFLWQK